ncbi:LysR substrate-binding domain-containing protein, partial [Streptococcus pyogenes]|uniref:LysR substrate-binding domain-containing protein n=1 Tax=Streptococcus pyogenes TaxID=1314 RepID=UPI003DA032C0
PLVLLVSEGHHLSARVKLSLAEVAEEPFVGLAEGSALQSLVANQARRLGGRIHYRVRLSSLESVCRMVGQGIGVSIVPKAVATQSEQPNGTIAVALTDAWAERNLVCAVRRREGLPAHAAKLLSHLLRPAHHAESARGRL